MIFNNHDINIVNLVMKILDIRSRFCQCGIMKAEDYVKAKNAPTQTLVYNINSLDDDGMFTVFAGFGNSEYYHEDCFVRYFKAEKPEKDFIEIAIPIVSQEYCNSCQDGDCRECANIEYYQLYLIGRDGSISQDIESNELYDEECCSDNDFHYCGCCTQEYREDAKTAADIMHCRETGLHNLCNCECGQEHCFVECGPVNDEDCNFNENGRCHCPHNHCCGCECECEPDEDDE